MAICIVISNKLKFKVKGTIKDEAGIDQPFDFSLTCQRLNADQIKAKIQDGDGRTVVDFMVDVIEDWANVKDEDGKPLPYSEEAFRELCKIASVAAVTYSTYLAEVGAKAKN